MIARAVDEVATQIGCGSAQVALSWLVHQGAIPIIDTRKAETCKSGREILAIVKTQFN